MSVLNRTSWYLSRRSGFTLVEMLVALVLMGLIAASIAPNLAGTTKRTQTDKMIADLIDLDARARVLSGKHRMCYFEYDETHHQIELFVVDENIESVQVINIPNFVVLNIEQGVDQGHTATIFNRLGQTENYQFTLTMDEDTSQIAFNGLTGWHEVMREVRP
ncbi:hypothetical protein COB72_01085 [bacterium]|nr:MAG: hypothetical protein COB72_01085 [bacterium]